MLLRVVKVLLVVDDVAKLQCNTATCDCETRVARRQLQRRQLVVVCQAAAATDAAAEHYHCEHVVPCRFVEKIPRNSTTRQEKCSKIWEIYGFHLARPKLLQLLQTPLLNQAATPINTDWVQI